MAAARATRDNDRIAVFVTPVSWADQTLGPVVDSSAGTNPNASFPQPPLALSTVCHNVRPLASVR